MFQREGSVGIWNVAGRTVAGAAVRSHTADVFSIRPQQGLVAKVALALVPTVSVVPAAALAGMSALLIWRNPILSLSGCSDTCGCRKQKHVVR